MKQLLTGIQARLMAEVPALKYVDIDCGQLDYFNPHPPVKWPVALFDVVNVNWSDVLKGAQFGPVTLRLRVADLAFSNSSGAAPQEQKDKALAIFDTLTAVHKALHGWAGDRSYSKLLRVKGPARIPREDGVRIYEMTYTTELYDASTSPAVATVSGIVPSVKPVLMLALDADAAIFFAAVTSAGGLLTEGQKSAVNQLVHSLKVSDIWPKLIALYPFVGDSAEAHKLNLKAPGQYSLTFYGSPSHTVNGTYFGPGQYARTGLSSAANLEKQNQHWSVYTRTEVVTDGAIHVLAADEFIQSAVFDWIAGAFGKAVIFQLSAPTQVSPLVPAGMRFALMSRLDAATITYAFDEIITSVPQPVSVNQNTSEICIGHTNGRDGNYECAAVSFGKGMTASEIAALNAAVKTFQSNLGR